MLCVWRRADTAYPRGHLCLPMRLPGPLTNRVFASLGAQSAVGGAGGTSQLDALLSQDAALRSVYAGVPQPCRSDFVQRMNTLLRPESPPADVSVDVAVCGGTLGILLACALQLSGHRVAVLEAGPLKGRAQDWNTSEEELRSLVEAGVLEESELAEVAPLAFGPMRCIFGPPSPDQYSLKLSGVLDISVSPEALLRRVRARFEAAGGVVLERTQVGSVRVHTDGARLALNNSVGASTLDCRLVLDCMGHRSPIALQQRVGSGQAPDGVCVQVGSCASSTAFRQWATTGDFFCTDSDASAAGPEGRARVQHFWQAFPTSGGDDERSTYMFTYLKPDEAMPSLLETMETYWERLPAYQRLQAVTQADSDSAELTAVDALDGLDVRRVVFGWFPTYREHTPLPPATDRVLSIGDASAAQSPISFGGFCCMLRHLPRLRRGVDLALRADTLDRASLSSLAPYLPNLATTWMSASAMTARVYGAPTAPTSDIVNSLLRGNFKVMGALPRSDAIQFFRDVTTLKVLTAVLVGQTLTMAPLLPSVVAELGAAELLGFGGHFSMLALYTLLHTAAEAVDQEGELAPDAPVTEAMYKRACQRDAWRYGSGLD